MTDKTALTCNAVEFRTSATVDIKIQNTATDTLTFSSGSTGNDPVVLSGVTIDARQT